MVMHQPSGSMDPKVMGNSPTIRCYTTHVVLRFKKKTFFQTSQRSSEHHYSSQLVCNTSHGEYAPGPGIADTEDAAEDTERSLGVICRIFLFPICDRSLESMFYMYICIYTYMNVCLYNVNIYMYIFPDAYIMLLHV